jgi:pyruvate,water dikinase
LNKFGITAKRAIISCSTVSRLDGDILVSSATNPDLIIAMKKAAGFVTDTGGITSHAAIVSRELKKPCISACAQERYKEKRIC